MLELKHVSFEVGDGGEKLEIIDDISLTLRDGRFLVITGPNGGGKSTLLSVIAGTERVAEADRHRPPLALFSLAVREPFDTDGSGIFVHSVRGSFLQRRVPGLCHGVRVEEAHLVGSVEPFQAFDVA